MKIRHHRRPARGWAWLAIAVGLCLPALVHGDVVRMTDGSTLKGRVLALRNDTLVVRTSFGAEVRIPRSRVELVSFTDTLVAAMPAPSQGVAESARRPESGTGRIGITFVDREISSKIVAPARGEHDPFMRANWIEQVLVVDDVVVFTRRDTTMDKTIYNGPERGFRNDIELEDFEVDVPAGFHHAALIVRNVGGQNFNDAFDPEALDLVLPLDNLEVPVDKTVRIKVGITRGRLRLKHPELYRVE